LSYQNAKDKSWGLEWGATTARENFIKRGGRVSQQEKREIFFEQGGRTIFPLGAKKRRPSLPGRRDVYGGGRNVSHREGGE